MNCFGPASIELPKIGQKRAEGQDGSPGWIRPSAPSLRAPARAAHDAGARTQRRQVRAPVDLALPGVTRSPGEDAICSVRSEPAARPSLSPLS